MMFSKNVLWPKPSTTLTALLPQAVNGVVSEALTVDRVLCVGWQRVQPESVSLNKAG